ncbi:BON domain-containing protein [Roseateles sp. BYS96W]|uniref:BON domain-containing protein n=1 Tax=Pelomonas nitida TaxID=3299027 RepID=A0ABW7G001_9BURK
MKFPKSMHAEGWVRHFDDGAAPRVAATTRPGIKAGAKPVNAYTPLHGDVPLQASRPIRMNAPMAPQAPRPSVAPAAMSTVGRAPVLPWVLSAGAAVVLIGGGALMARNRPVSTPAEPIVVSQASPSPEEAQLAAEPPSAGAASAAEPAPEVVSTPVEHPPVKLAPAEEQMAATKQAAPVTRTLQPPPEVMAVAAPAPASAPASGVALPALAQASELPASAAAPASADTPPVAQAAPSATEPADAGITMQVRQALAADAALATVPIAVSTAQGVVKLEGQAPDAQARERATVVAAATSGVKGVDNRLTLPPVASLDKPLLASGG